MAWLPYNSIYKPAIEWEPGALVLSQDDYCSHCKSWMVITGNSFSKCSSTDDQQLSLEECGLKTFYLHTPVDTSYKITTSGLVCEI